MIENALRDTYIGTRRFYIVASRERLFQFVLDGQAGALALPALVGLTVVGDAQCNSHWRVSVVKGDRN